VAVKKILKIMSQTTNEISNWNGGNRPYVASYGKLMMWFFLITDALTFSAFLSGYGFSRFKYGEVWPSAEDVFTHFPFLHGDHPLLFVALMTFILIMSSVTMVLAVNYGHKMQKKKVILWLSLTIVGGFMFLGSQAWEWGHFIHGDKAAIQTHTLEVFHIAKDNELSSVYELMGVDGHDGTHHHFSVEEVGEALYNNSEYGIRISDKTYLDHETAVKYYDKNAQEVLIGANLHNNEYGQGLFADYFFFITGFHGFHVFSGVIILLIILINVIKGTYEKRGHYEMVEKVGLYWHFVDLVWVFVFTFFYLV
jgi:cytochrome c oxidase subunit III